MNYNQDIYKVLVLAGDGGLKLEKIARHVFNACNSFFNPLNYKDVHLYVSQFLSRQAKNPDSIIQKGDGHGVYRIDFNKSEAQKMMLQFAPHEENTEEVKTTNKDLSLSLFD